MSAGGDPVLGAREAIEEIVHRETRAWDQQDVDLLLSIFHEDMVWPWPPAEDAHDPIDWVEGMGRFDRDRWRRTYERLFDAHVLVHNRRDIVRVQPFAEGDGGFAVVDVDTLWRRRADAADFHWRGRACKGYALVGREWRMTMHTGLLAYG